MMYALLAFRPEVTPARANHLLYLASQLTYRQLVVLAITNDDGNRERLRHRSYRDDAEAIAQLGGEGVALLIEIYDIYQRGLLSETGGETWICVADVNPRAMRLQGSAYALTALMGLATISAQDRVPIYAALT